jgi:hypothetical protein
MCVRVCTCAELDPDWISNVQDVVAKSACQFALFYFICVPFASAHAFALLHVFILCYALFRFNILVHDCRLD